MARLTAIAAITALATLAGPARATDGMIVTAQRLASEVGRDVLAHGGNAIDAAVAVGYALAVVDPCCGNIGGGGFMVIHLADGRDRFVNFRERAPRAAKADMFLDESGAPVPDRSRFGWLAVGVPGTVAGLEHARAAYGTMSREPLIAPAIKLAEDGFTLGPGDIATLGLMTDRFAKQPNVAKTFLNDGKPWAAGETLKQPDLAATLKLISAGGTSAFYRGPIAEKIAAASAANGGILEAADLDRYIVTDDDPVRCPYRGLTVVTSAPPSSGGVTLCEILRTLEGYDLGAHPFHSVEDVHLTVEAERHAYADRNTYLGDPDFVVNPVEKLLADDYAAKTRAAIVQDRATASAGVEPGLGGQPQFVAEGEHTTHYSVADAAGNAVSVTYTINLYFGAGVIASDTGFFLNDEMDDFTSKPGSPNAFGLVQGAANAVAPDKRPLSSMTPSVLLRNGRVFMVVGAPGGSRIPTEVLGVIQNVVDHGMSVADAVAAPRIHHQYLPDTVYMEPGALAPDVQAALQEEGYGLTEQKPWGLAEAIEVAPDGSLQGAADPRRPGGAAVSTR
jgi:gamma-glutamyltranspeptidase/glutathione hydrolase